MSVYSELFFVGGGGNGLLGLGDFFDATDGSVGDGDLIGGIASLGICGFNVSDADEFWVSATDGAGWVAIGRSGSNGGGDLLSAKFMQVENATGPLGEGSKHISPLPEPTERPISQNSIKNLPAFPFAETALWRGSTPRPITLKEETEKKYQAASPYAFLLLVQTSLPIPPLQRVVMREISSLK